MGGAELLCGLAAIAVGIADLARQEATEGQLRFSAAMALSGLAKTLGPQEWTALLQKADGNFALSCFTAEQRKSRLAIIPNTAVTAEQAAQLSDLARQQAIAMITGSVTGDQDLTLSITPESKYQPWNTQALYHALVQIFPDQHYEKKDAKCQNVPPYDCTLTLRPIQNGQIAPSSVNLTPAEETAIKTREDHLKNIVEKNADRKKKYTPISRDILQQVGTQLPSKEDKWEFTYTNARGEVFYLAEGVWENYQYGGHDDGETARPALSRVISFWQKGAEGLVRGTLPVRDFCKKNGIKITCNPQDFQQKIDDKIAQAKDTFTSEEQNTQIVRSLDLPKDAKIAHLALFPTDYRTEPVISGIADDPIATNALLKKAGYQIAPPQIIATASPKAALTAAVKQALREGKREIYLDLVGHGNAQGVHFGTEPGAILKGSDLMEIINEATSSHPGVHFVINSVACHGGGFRRDFYDQFISGHPQAKTKVDLILQGKPDATNEEAVNTDGRPLSTYFNLFYLQALAKMGTTESIKIRGEEFPIKTIGDAIRYADVMSGQYTHANAEVIQHQKQQVALSKSIGPLPDPQ